MIVAKTIQDVRANVCAARREGQRIGLVPTMGALHAGHLSLVRTAKDACQYVAVSIFVNPTQFGPREDLATYPRPVEADLAACGSAGVGIVFLPDPETMYPEGFATTVSVSGLTETLCGSSRPTHFAGVTTVCAKLFNIVAPDAAFFGAKDFQQAVVIERMVRDLDLPLQIVRCPIVREADGLALSSRNAKLSPSHRAQAPALHAALTAAEEMILASRPPAAEVTAAVREALSARAPDGRIDYCEVVDPETLQSVDATDGAVLVAVAVFFDTTRLIDNVRVDSASQDG